MEVERDAEYFDYFAGVFNLRRYRVFIGVKDTFAQTSEAFVFWKGRATEWTSFHACAEARDMEFVRTPPEGRSLTAGVTIIRTTERHAFSRVSAISRPAPLFCILFSGKTKMEPNSKPA